MSYNYFQYRLLFFLLFFINLGYSQNTDSSKVETSSKPKIKVDLSEFDTSTTIFQKIKQDSFLEVVIKTNFDSLIKNRKVSLKAYPGTILLKNSKGEKLKFKVKIQPRGRSRRKVCEMPPLKIDFPKKALTKLNLYPGCDKLKLVTNCNDTENSDQVLMKEYWSYQLLNKITPESFQVTLLKITYVNENDPLERIERYGFLIESNEELALRLKGKSVSGFGTTPDQITANSYHTTLIFQYMIGNLDWDIRVCRNVKLIQPNAGGKLILVPYDFDYAGLVKAPHARLNPDFKQKHIEERFPQGKFASKQVLKETVDKFLALEKQELRCYQECTILEKSVKRKMRNYLGSFFSFLKRKSELYDTFLEGE